MVLLAIAVLVYGAAFLISEWISNLIGIPYVVTVPVIAILLCVVLFVFKRNGLQKKFKICFPNNMWKCFLYAMPLVVIPLMNIYMMNDRMQASIDFSGAEVLFIAFLGLSAFSEELLFRGVFPGMLLERFRFSVFQRSLFVNVLFAFVHMGNALGGASLETAIVQSALALSIGICFSGITEKTESLYPAACLHFLINLSSPHKDYSSSIPFRELWIWIGISTMCMIYGILLIRSNKEEM